jgi:hypothetical protein
MDVARASRGGGLAAVATAAAVMDGFRLAPAGLHDAELAPLTQLLPDTVRKAIETDLKDEGFLAGKPSGDFGPDVRKALAVWVDAKGPLRP